MIIEQSRAARDAVPFRPFTIHMLDGRSWRVPSPEHLSTSPSGKTALIFHRRAWNMLDLPSVSHLVIEPIALPPNNGDAGGNVPNA
jgi:hypothetical protein